MNSEQLALRGAPATNDEGIRSAIEQFKQRKFAGWQLEYDRAADCFYMRKPNAGPAVTYFHPAEPRLLFRLDCVTGELTGIDLADLRFLAKDHPEFAPLLPKGWLSALFHPRRNTEAETVRSIRRAFDGFAYC